MAQRPRFSAGPRQFGSSQEEEAALSNFCCTTLQRASRSDPELGLGFLLKCEQTKCKLEPPFYARDVYIFCPEQHTHSPLSLLPPTPLSVRIVYLEKSVLLFVYTM